MQQVLNKSDMHVQQMEYRFRKSGYKACIEKKNARQGVKFTTRKIIQYKTGQCMKYKLGHV